MSSKNRRLHRLANLGCLAGPREGSKIELVYLPIVGWLHAGCLAVDCLVCSQSVDSAVAHQLESC